MLVLTKDKYKDLVELIDYIHGFYPVKHQQLAAVYSELENWVEENSCLFHPKDLIDGKAYGLLVYNPRCNTYNRKTGKELIFHGDIYSGLWYWNNSKKEFECRTAWGGFYSKKLSEIHMPLIDYP